MIVSHLIVKNWRNFRSVDVPLKERMFLIGPTLPASRTSSTSSGFCGTSQRPGRRAAAGCASPGRTL